MKRGFDALIFDEKKTKIQTRFFNVVWLLKINNGLHARMDGIEVNTVIIVF